MTVADDPAEVRPISIPVQAVVVSDEDGGRRARITAAQFERWVEFANAAFRDAEIGFVFDRRADVAELRSRTLNDMMGAEDARWRAVKALGNEVAAGFPGRLVVFVRYGVGRVATGAAFAGIDHDFVVMGGFDVMNHCGHPHVDALAHEIGHYLGLSHTFVGEPFRTVEEAEVHLAKHGGDPRAFDGDGFTDTLPDPAIRALECERRERVVLNGQTFVLPRRNLMSYYDERDSLSPRQIERARWVLARRHSHGMRLPTNDPGRGGVAAEALEVVTAARCSPSAQAMAGFGPGRWSGDSQLFCGAEPGAVLTLALPVATTGTYGVVLYATLAPDFGVVQCTVDGARCGPSVDLYAPLVLPTGAMPLGRLRLAAGTHEIAFEICGQHADSIGCHFGIDAIELGDSDR